MNAIADVLIASGAAAVYAFAFTETRRIAGAERRNPEYCTDGCRRKNGCRLHPTGEELSDNSVPVGAGAA